MYTNYKTKTAAVRAAAQHSKHYAAQNAAWRGLCETYLPRADSSIWRFSAAGLPSRVQGWKLHVAATIFTAVEVLKRIGPLLEKREVSFKAPASLHELSKLNAGIFYGYSQVGKVLTIYPRTDLEAQELARELHHLTRDIVAPAIPFDLPYQCDSHVYYRYGAFIEQRVESEGQNKLAIQDPDGNLIPDQRDATSPPSWVPNPFVSTHQESDQAQPTTLLTTRFKAFRALARRGKGGVYQAVDFSTAPRLCILKEGRRHGEVGIDGRDGFWRIQHEEHAIRSLASKGLEVQSIYAGFQAEKNYYLALEYIEGQPLQAYLESRQRRLSMTSILRKSIDIATILADIHKAGWAWRDCKPQNLIVTKTGRLRAIDFEGACTLANPDPFPWGTCPYSPAEAQEPFRGQCRLPEDLHALGVIIFLLLAGRLPEAEGEPVQALRKGVPKGLCEILTALLQKDPSRRPAAEIVKARLIEELDRYRSKLSTEADQSVSPD